MKATDFYTSHMVIYQRESRARYSYQSIKVLPEVWGCPWDDIALGFVHGLRPSAIRVVRDMETMDSWPSRVTVYVDANNIITSIRQEVEVWLPEGVKNGHDLRVRLEKQRPR